PLDDSTLGGSEAKNLVIVTSGKGCKSKFSALMTDCVPDLNFMIASQCFPLYWYQNGKKEYAMQEKALQMIRRFYGEASLSYEDVFYYLYGLFHHRGYTSRYHSNLSKELPRIPFASDLSTFKKISKAGEELGDMHACYDKQPLWDCKVEIIKDKDPEKLNLEEKERFYRVTKMRFEDKKDKSKIQVNHNISISGIPLHAYDYKVNGRSALSWVMQRQTVKSDKESSILYDPNSYALETMKNLKYPYEHLLRMITVSMKTLEIVAKMPQVDFDTCADRSLEGDIFSQSYKKAA
ncbi:MAG: hypothetical protein OXC40_01375, partial [Proteobacteria bacterium]|nr:hypothetical protein [Pseudomonadota bacterium]